jgi:hypothetical protein
MDQGEVRKELKKRAPAHAHDIDAAPGLPLFKEYVLESCFHGDWWWPLLSPYKAVKEDLAYLKQLPFLKKETKLHGFVFDVQTGLLNPVN